MMKRGMLPFSISFFDLVIAIILFVCFDITLIFFPTLSDQVVVFWDIYGKEILKAKSVGVFIYPFVILGMTGVFLILTKLFLDNERMKRLKGVVLGWLSFLYCIFILNNFTAMTLDPVRILVLCFAAGSIAIGVLLIQKQKRGTENLQKNSESNERSYFSYASLDSLNQGGLHQEKTSVFSTENYRLLEGSGLIILGVFYLTALFLQDPFRMIALGVFLYSLFYFFLMLYSFLVKLSHNQQGIEKIVHFYTNPPQKITTPMMVYEDEKKVEIKKRTIKKKKKKIIQKEKKKGRVKRKIVVREEKTTVEQAKIK